MDKFYLINGVNEGIGNQICDEIILVKIFKLQMFSLLNTNRHLNHEILLSFIHSFLILFMCYSHFFLFNVMKWENFLSDCILCCCYIFIFFSSSCWLSDHVHHLHCYMYICKLINFIHLMTIHWFNCHDKF